MGATLVSIGGPSAGKEHSLESECFLGRSFNSEIYVGDLNVSRRHAKIHAEKNGVHVIEDLGSGNGTFVNDKQITTHELKPKDVVRIGGSSFRYEATRKQKWADEVLTMIADGQTSVPGVASGTLDSGKPRVSAEDLARSDNTADVLAGLSEGRAVKMLEVMFGVADIIGNELDLPKLLDKILGHLLEIFPQAERGFVLLVNPRDGQLVPEAVKQRRSGFSGGLEFSRTMVNQVMEQGEGVIRDPSGQPIPGADAALASITSPGSSAEGGPKMGAPMICGGESLGTLHMEARSGSYPFSPEDLELLTAIARQASLAIANARAGQALVTQKRLEDDLRLARQIQHSFLPKELPQVPGLKFDTHYVPALKVGGDFYDIYELDETHIGILAGDISGKGVSAALLMAKLTTDIRILSRQHQAPSEVMTRANKALIASGQDGMFATVIYILLDLEQQTFTVANAGHQPPMVASKRFSGIAELDDATAVALGVIPDMDYPQEVYKLVTDDVVLLYTDGINEAMNRSSEEYGMERLRASVLNGPPDPSLLVQRLVADVQRFVGGAPQSDDQTLVTFGLHTV